MIDHINGDKDQSIVIQQWDMQIYIKIGMSEKQHIYFHFNHTHIRRIFLPELILEQQKHLT